MSLPNYVREENATAHLTHALLLWHDRTKANSNEARLVFASLNAVIEGVIQPATQALTVAQLRGLCDNVADLCNEAAGKAPVDIAPEHVLYTDRYQACTVWWRAGRPTPQFFDCEELGQIQGVCAMPSLVFKQVGTSLSVCAIAGTQRPTSATPVCHAPLFNTYDSGGVCLGGVKLAPVTSYDVIAENESAFLRGINTHPNGGHRKTAYPHGVFALWRDLIANPALRWNDDWLVPMNLTLGQWLKKA